MATETINPINNGIINKTSRRRTGRIKFVDIVPPIETEIIDDKETQQTFSNYPLIPYSGCEAYSSHKTVELLYGMKNMSPTFGGVVDLHKRYLTSEKINIVPQKDSVFHIDDEETEVSKSDKIKFSQAIKDLFIFQPGSLKTLTDCEDESMLTTGMIGVQVTTTYYLGVTKVFVKYHHPTDYCFYKNSQWGTEVALSKRWDENHLKQFPPKVIPVYPLEAVYKDKSVETFFFVKNGGYLYGRPGDMGALYDKYTEGKIKQFVSKKMKRAWTPDLLIEFEDGQMSGGLLDDTAAEAAGYGNAGDRIDERFSNYGDDPRSIYATTRPPGADPMTVHEVSTFKNAKDLTELLNQCFCSILYANNVPEMLYKLSGATGFSNDIFMDVFNIYNVTVNNEAQTRLEALNNSILNYGFSKIGIENTTGIRYVSPIQKLLDEYSNSKTSVDPQPGLTKVGRTAKAYL